MTNLMLEVEELPRFDEGLIRSHLLRPYVSLLSTYSSFSVYVKYKTYYQAEHGTILIVPGIKTTFPPSATTHILYESIANIHPLSCTNVI